MSLDVITNTQIEPADNDDAVDNDNQNAHPAAKIPVRNWWHMLLYAWNLAEFKDRHNDVIKEEAPDDLHALLTLILTEITNKQIRRGLRGEYVDRSELLKTVRGRIDFTGTLRELALYRGQLRCEYDEYSLNVPRNQIIISTLYQSLSRGFDQNHDLAINLQRRVERLIHMMIDIERVRLSRRLIAGELRKLGRNEREYQLVLRICDMLYQLEMPLDDEEGNQMRYWEKLTEWKVYETFVANFYKLHNSNEWNVDTQTHLRWNSPDGDVGDDLRLPSMKPDIVMTRKNDTEQIIVIDTKWYKSVADRHYGAPSVHAGNLYQMYSYLASQDHQGEPYPTATGILLYGQTKEGAQQVNTRIDAHPFRVATLDLTQEWRHIEASLQTLIKEATM